MAGDRVFSRISRISYRALSLAATLKMRESPDIARWLYRYGSYPRGPLAELDLGPGDDPMAILGLTRGGRVRRNLESVYEATTHQGWFSFALMSEPVITQAACKLYVSPSPQALSMAFPVIAETYAEMGVRSFKVGRGIEGLLRPDKIVAYFNNHSELEDVVKRLSKKLKGCPAQPVPFTGELGLDGLLSWGIDPPPNAVGLSWRSWITKQLANEIVKARSAANNVVVETALGGIESLGINTSQWTVERSAFFGEQS